MSDDNVFRDAKNTLAELERANREHQRLLNRRCDWDDPSDVAEYRKEERRDERREILDRLVPSRFCPECDDIKPGLRQWVIAADQSAAICRSCHQRRFGVKGVIVNLQIRLLGDRFVRYEIKPDMIRKARARTGLSIREFARQAGWSKSYQTKIEKLDGGVQTLSVDSVRVLFTVLRENGVIPQDVIAD